MIVRSPIPLLRLMFGALVLIAGSLAAPAVAAQDAGGDYSLDIIPAGDAIAAIPDGSVRVAVTSADGSVDYGSCMLSMDTKPAGCSVMVPAGTAVTVALDDSTLPEGIGVVEATQQYTTPAEKTQVGDVWFEFTWVTDGDDDADAPEDDRDVRELPSTGTGPTDAGNRATLAAASSLLAITTLAGALTARLMRQR